MEEETLDLAPLEDIFEEYETKKGAIIPVLQKAQAIYGYLPDEVYGVATFYSQFYLTRRGRHIVRQCDGTACHVRGSARIINVVARDLGIKADETTPDYRVTYEVVYCLGSCGLAPTAVIDDNVYGHLNPEKMTELVRELP